MSNMQFNVWSEFQPLSRAVVGNICGVEEIDIPFANQKHIDNLKTGKHSSHFLGWGVLNNYTSYTLIFVLF